MYVTAKTYTEETRILATEQMANVASSWKIAMLSPESKELDQLGFYVTQMLCCGIDCISLKSTRPFSFHFIFISLPRWKLLLI